MMEEKKARGIKKLGKLLLDLLKQGTSPSELALTLSLGAVIGIIPVLGSTTILCALVAMRLKLNLPLIQILNYLIYPLQLIFFIPFLQSAQIFYPNILLPNSIEEFYILITTNFWEALNILWKANLIAVFSWAVISIPFGFGVYSGSIYLLKKFQAKRIPIQTNY